jgi:DNA-3-methyladenine glycosylase II
MSPTPRMAASPRSESLEFDVEAVRPFRLELAVWVLRRRPENLVDRWDGETYRRALIVDGTAVDVAVRQVGDAQEPRLRVNVQDVGSSSSERVRSVTTRFVQHALGISIDLGDFKRFVRAHPDLRALATRFDGMKPTRFPSLFESMVNAVACQQLSLAVGITLLGRLSEAYGRVPPNAPGRYAFPQPEDVLTTSPRQLRQLGFSERKARSIIAIAHAIANGLVTCGQLDTLDDSAAAKMLTSLPGIGRWSAEYVLLRGLGRLNVFPADDVGARHNLERVLDVPGPLDYQSTRDLTTRWQGFAGLVYFHLLLHRIEANGWLIARDALTCARDARDE